jgi:hypothetical protein
MFVEFWMATRHTRERIAFTESVSDRALEPEIVTCHCGYRARTSFGPCPHVSQIGNGHDSWGYPPSPRSTGIRDLEENCEIIYGTQ